MDLWWNEGVGLYIPTVRLATGLGLLSSVPSRPEMRSEVYQNITKGTIDIKDVSIPAKQKVVGYSTAIIQVYPLSVSRPRLGILH